VVWIVRLVSVGAEGEEHGTDIMRVTRPGDLTDLARLGLTLAEGKRLLAGVQQGIVAAQARVHAAQRPECRSCGTACRVRTTASTGSPRCSARSRSGCPASAAPAAAGRRRAWPGRRTPARPRILYGDFGVKLRSAGLPLILRGDRRHTGPRGACQLGAGHRAATLYSVGLTARTMMQPCASGAKLRAAGPF
jgi:hypothetical protein